MKIFLAYVCTAISVFAQTDFDFPEPLDIKALTDEQASSIIVPITVVEPIRVPVAIVSPIQVRVATVDLAEVLVANVPGISVATVNLVCQAVSAIGVQVVDVATISAVAKAVELVNLEPVSLVTVGSLQAVVNAMSVSTATPEAVQIVISALEAANCRVVSPAVIAVALRQIAAGQIQPRAVDVIEISLSDRRIPEIQAFWKKCAEIFADQRMIDHDCGLDFDSPAVKKWLAIYECPLPPLIQLVSLPYNIRMIAELRLFSDGSIPPAAAHNLAIYAALGYNACLITVSGQDLLPPASNRLAALMELVSIIRNAGMAPWFAWSGPESLSATIFDDPDQVSRLLAAMARISDGYLCAWRRTSAHLVQQDPQYLEHITHIVRKANPAIPIIGESYYGQTWQNEPFVRQSGWQARDNTPRNPSGILIAGISTRGYNVEYLLSTTFARWQGVPRLGLVLGDRPYYASSADNGLDFTANLRIKQEIENRFRRAGCIGTITIHGDGSDHGAAPQASDNLGEHEI